MFWTHEMLWIVISSLLQISTRSINRWERTMQLWDSAIQWYGTTATYSDMCLPVVIAACRATIRRQDVRPIIIWYVCSCSRNQTPADLVFAIATEQTSALYDDCWLCHRNGEKDEKRFDNTQLTSRKSCTRKSTHVPPHLSILCPSP